MQFFRVKSLCTYSVVTNSSIPQDGLADKRHINFLLQENKRNKSMIRGEVNGYMLKLKVQLSRRETDYSEELRDELLPGALWASRLRTMAEALQNK